MDRSQPTEGDRQEELLPWGMLLILVPCSPQAQQGGRGLLRALLWDRARGHQCHQLRGLQAQTA